MTRWFGHNLDTSDIDQFEEPWPPDIWGQADWREDDTDLEMVCGRGATSGVE